MGYTHYWESSAAVIPPAAVTIIREVLDRAFAAGIAREEHDRPGPPVVTPTLIRFNGVGPLGHETFRFDVHDAYRTAQGKPFAFCKTERKPYDATVMRVLVILKWYLGDRLNVESDGRFDAEWREARAEMRDRYGLATAAAEELLVAA